MADAGVLVLSNVVLAAGLVVLAAANGVVMLVRRLGRSRRRNGAWALRCRLCGAHRALRPQRARADHRHYAVRRFCLDGELAVVDVSQRRARAGARRCWSGRRSISSSALPLNLLLPAPDAARAGFPRRRTLDRLEAIQGDVSSCFRVRGGLVRDRRDGGASAAIAGTRRGYAAAGDRRRGAGRAGAGGGAAGRILFAAPEPPACFRRGSPRCCIRSVPPFLRSSARRRLRRSPFSTVPATGF